MSAPVAPQTPEKTLVPADDYSPRSGEAVEKREAKVAGKMQPWKKVWPNNRLAGTQMQVYGFKKGEVMEILGNAGNFFAHGHWEVEYDTLSCKDSEAAKSEIDKTTT
jgi:hypothetical protein